MRLHRLALSCLLLPAAALPAAQVTAGGGTGFQRPAEENEREAKAAPAWIADPTEGGKVRGTVASWANGASKEEQKQARADATAKLIDSLKLPAGTRLKEMNMWIDQKAQKTYVLLVAR